ncbi:MAG: DUF2905 domain-containing protein [candidate division KSB1 bacterium]|nr:DUF2905 domain-containing protein [candidate division KSB1 bacterium]
MGRWFIAAGILFIVIGLILHFAPWLLNWFGRLPGDIRWEGERSRVYIPVTSMIVVSLVITLIINLLFKR